MTIHAIIDLQRSIFLQLSQDEELSELNVSGVFSQVPKDVSYPYINLGKNILKDWSTKTSKGYQITFDIIVMDKSMSSKRALSISDRIEEIILDKKFVLDSYKELRTALLANEFIQKPKNSSQQITLKFKTYLEA